MDINEKWIWLNNSEYENSSEECSVCADGTAKGYEVVSFVRNYDFKKSIKSISLRFSADTFCRVYLNDAFIASGPPSAGGDFLQDWLPRRSYYSTELKVDTIDEKMSQGKCDFYAVVRKAPVRINEFSSGVGGFYLQAEVLFEDGTIANISTDETWLGKREKAHIRPRFYDDTVGSERESNAVIIENRWHTKTAPIPPCEEHSVPLENNGIIYVDGCTRKSVVFDLDKVYAGYMQVRASKSAKITLRYFETDNLTDDSEITFTNSYYYIGFEVLSVGKIEIDVLNLSEESNEIHVSFLASNYPVTQQAKTITSDKELNNVLEVCAHSLKYCRQSMHLDSPRHCEPLACTGDYYIATLMTAFTFGDMRLSSFDVCRTAEILENQDGRIFHTTYSLIWALMLWDTYLLTGEMGLLLYCEKALDLLLNRFERYIGETGLIENPPDYMFIDWLVVDGYSIHHPPKALGQTCLNLFYFGALKTANKIYQKIGSEAKAEGCIHKAIILKNYIINLLWDKEKELFFEGLNTLTPEHLLGTFMPQNCEKRYYRKHANILAAYFEIFDKKKNGLLLEKVLADESLGEVQPYFMHYLLEAVYKNGLRDKYTINLLAQWKQPIAECSKGLPEGFYPPEKGYCFDHSHAWGGTPAYALPLALSGLSIEEEGFKKITFSPSLCGLEYANIEIPTPYGMIRLKLSKGESPKIFAPKEIQISLRG